MSGMDRQTGRAIDDRAHLAQSITDILTTPIGSRVMRRDYGSNLPRLIDAPINGRTLVDLAHATAEALDRWEPRILPHRVDLVEAGPDGAAAIRIDFEDATGPGQVDVPIGRAS